MVPSQHPSSSRPGGALLAVGAAFPADRVPRGRGRRCAARPDEDAITLAVQAGAEALEDREPPAALLLATTTPPYDEGGSVQVVAELLRLAPDIWSGELTATARDGLAAVRVGLALAQAYEAPVLVCAAHATRHHEGGEGGDGAVALLVGPDADEGLARLVPGPAHVEELRDRWRLRGDAVTREGDTSFIYEYGGSRLASLVGARAVGTSSVPVAVSTLNARAAARAETSLGGPGDDLVARTGILGAAHALLRLARGLEATQIVVAVAGGIAESVHVAPLAPRATEVSERLRARAVGGVDRQEPVPEPSGAGFDPYASGPRAWRERAQDLRLEAGYEGGGVRYPPPAGSGDGAATAPLARLGTVLTHTRDHVYPGGEVTGMAVLELDDGGRFYGQVAMGEEVEIGSRVQLAPRRLHQGGGVVQYFWKAVPCP